jgi:hypothetical protein
MAKLMGKAVTAGESNCSGVWGKTKVKRGTNAIPGVLAAVPIRPASSVRLSVHMKQLENGQADSDRI